jgi:non-heme chloroperoxidase
MKLVLATILILSLPKLAQAQMDLSKLRMDYSALPELSSFSARDGQELPYRYYPSSSENLFVLLHGSGSHSRYLYALAKELSASGKAQVITPDLRGHGVNPPKRGDVDYIGQLDDDLLDLLKFTRQRYALQKIFVGGHSSGGGLALRLAGGKNGDMVDGYIFIAPYLAHDAPTLNQKSGWADGRLLPIIAATILNKLGLHWLDHVVTVTFNMPEEYRDGTETLAYTHALTTSYAPADYQADLKKISKPSLLIIGADDEAMVAKAFPALLDAAANLKIQFQSLPGINHMGIVVRKNAIHALADWIDDHD